VLVAAGLLTEQHAIFSNTTETNQFLGEGGTFVHRQSTAAIAKRWRENFKTADSIRSGVPKVKLDSPMLRGRIGTFLRNINASKIPSARALVQTADLSSVKTLLDAGCGRVPGVPERITKACPGIRRLRLI
jgi:hypothetical protein